MRKFNMTAEHWMRKSGNPNPVEYMRLFTVDAERIPAGDLEKAWFLHRRCCQQQINPELVMLASGVFFLALALIGSKFSDAVYFLSLGVALPPIVITYFVDRHVARKTEWDANAYINWMIAISRKTHQFD